VGQAGGLNSQRAPAAGRREPTVLYDLARPLVFRLDPETAHHLAFSNLDRAHALGLTRLLRPHVADDPLEVMGLDFPNPVGLAAGLDKNAEHIDALADFGFASSRSHRHAAAAAGNPAPRLFRLPPARALINRMGFNNEGSTASSPTCRRAAAAASCWG